jgi:hypothetical protein
MPTANDQELRELGKESVVHKTRIDILEEKMKGFVTRDEFFVVKSIVYGLAGSILLTVLAAIVSKVILK